MKRLFGISLVAVLAISPMIAKAEAVAGEPAAGNASSPTASAAPKYALKPAADSDVNAATAGYVKGAYNALIKGINKTHDEVGTLNTGIGTYSNAVSHLLDDTATQNGAVATTDTATMTERIATSSVNISEVTPSSLSATASGTVNISVPAMADWATDAAAASPVQTTAHFSGLTVNELAMAAPSTNTATLTKTGISGNVDVVEYLAQAAAAHYNGYQTLISTGYSSSGYKNANGTQSYNADGLENGEWKVKWNAYGTAKGISQCSSTGETTYSPGRTITTDLNLDPNLMWRYCWCKLTSFTDNNNTTYNDTSLWTFGGWTAKGPDCLSSCANWCASYSEVWSGVFGSVQ